MNIEASRAKEEASSPLFSSSSSSVQSVLLGSWLTRHIRQRKEDHGMRSGSEGQLDPSFFIAFRNHSAIEPFFRANLKT
jgi:hypothetical protein